jgi:hypothetical protein
MTKAVPVYTTSARARRHALIGQIRPLAEDLGASWVRRHGSPKYGKAMMRDCTDAQLAEMHAAAVAAATAQLL